MRRLEQKRGRVGMVFFVEDLRGKLFEIKDII